MGNTSAGAAHEVLGLLSKLTEMMDSLSSEVTARVIEPINGYLSGELAEAKHGPIGARKVHTLVLMRARESRARHQATCEKKKKRKKKEEKKKEEKEEEQEQEEKKKKTIPFL